MGVYVENTNIYMIAFVANRATKANTIIAHDNFQ